MYLTVLFKLPILCLSKFNIRKDLVSHYTFVMSLLLKQTSS